MITDHPNGALTRDSGEIAHPHRIAELLLSAGVGFPQRRDHLRVTVEGEVGDVGTTKLRADKTLGVAYERHVHVPELEVDMERDVGFKKSNSHEERLLALHDHPVQSLHCSLSHLEIQ